MIKIELKGLEQLKSIVKGMTDRDARKAIGTGLTSTAYLAMVEAKKFAEQKIDRPIKYTVNQIKYSKANADNLVAAVGYNVLPDQQVGASKPNVEKKVGTKGQTPAQSYLPHLQLGGNRNFKKLEIKLQRMGVLPKGWFMVPARSTEKNAYGNVPQRIYNKVIAALQDRTDFTRASRSKTGRTRKAAPIKNFYTVISPEFLAQYKGRIKTPGIYLTGDPIPTAKGKSYRRLKAVFLFKQALNYKPDYQVYDQIQDSIQKNFLEQVKLGYDKQLEYIAKRGNAAKT